MSLQVWLPLNGSLDEKISNQSVIAPGSLSLPSATTDGKLGTGYTFLNNGIKITNVIATSEMSFAMWVKIPQENFGSCHLLDFRVWDGSIGYQPIYFDSASNSIQIHSSKNNVNGNRPVDLTDYQWHHLTVTMNNNNCRLYVDGALSGEPLSGLEMYDNVITDLNIGCRCNATSTCSGLIQDVRIYDHCLSPREVKLLAQGLVAHYKLDDSYLEGTTNLLNGVWTHTNFWEAPLGTYSALSTQLNGGACEVVEFNNIKCLRFQVLPGEEQGRIFSTYPIKANITYTVSLDYYASSTRYNALKVELNGGDYYWTPSSCSYSTLNQWKRLSITITPTSDTTLYIFAYGNINEYAYINNIQLEEKDHATPYTPSSRNNNIAYDCSGYGNHGTTSASFELTNGDAPRYKNCTIFENNKYINCSRSAMVTDALTVSMWAYMDNWSTAGSYRLISCAQSGGWDIWPNGNKYMTMELYRNGKYITGISETPFTDTTGKWKTGWHHIVGTYDGYKAEFYLDGVKGTTSEISDTKYSITYHSSNSLFIGAEAGESATTPDAIYFNGKVSDVRIYATALSAAAVKELYQSSISFLDNGTLQCSEIVENSINLKYNQNGIVQTTKIEEANTNLKLYNDKIQTFQIYEL